MRPASSGLVTLPRNWASSSGSDALKRSFLPNGITTSFTNGAPRRDTLTHSPDCRTNGSRSLRLRLAMRWVSEYTPMIELGPVSPLSP